MPKLVCELSKQVRLETGGLKTAGVRLEVEIVAETARNPGRLLQHIRCGFDRVREAIDEELARAEPQRDLAGAGPPSTSNGRSSGHKSARPATSSQLRLLRVLAGRKDADLAGLSRDRYGKEDSAELTLAEASGLIDELGGGHREPERR